MSVGWIVVVAAVERAASDTVDFAGQNPVAEWHAEGLWNMEGLGTFNGQPLSETNQPSTSQRRLACDVSLYAIPDAPMAAYVRLHGIVTTQGLSFSGPDSFLGSMSVTQVRLEFATYAGVPMVVTLSSNQFANLGQVLQHGTCSAPVTTPMATTDGWGSSAGTPQFVVGCTTFPAYAMSTWGYYCGATSRIRGGGVFRVEFEASLVGQIDACASSVQVVFGNNAQVFDAAPDECRCDADLNSDGFVSASDLSLFFNEWGAQGSTATDLDGDGVTGAADLSLVLANWGPCP
jgi:hypothetical protein